ncbi:MAG: hypothetical protein LBC39_03340 [Methanobrevibacter sp.]|jgi:hypothetical protein|nr:hypothetical protein [Candidatus Methanovirga aequatorialis]
MKKSRLSLFKSTSMLISMLGIFMIVTTLGVAVYIGICIVSDSITSNIEHGSQSDKLSSLKSNYTTLTNMFNDKKERSYNSNGVSLDTNYVNAASAINVAKSALDNVNSAIYSNKPNSEIDKEMKTAEEKLQIAYDFVNKL